MVHKNTILYRCYMFRRHLRHLQLAVHQDLNLTAIRYGTQYTMCRVKFRAGSKKKLDVCVRRKRTAWPQAIFRHVRQKLRKATISFVISVRLSVWNNSAPIGRILMKLCIVVFFFRKSVEKIQVSLKSDNNNRYFTWRLYYILYYYIYYIIILY